MAVPVKSSAGRLHSQHTCIPLHGLPYVYCTEGLIQILLDCAGCPRDTYTVRGEFFGDLAGEPAAGSHLVGNGSACLAYIQTPDDDRQLGRLPMHFIIDGDTRINITRPWQMRQPCQPTSLQAALSASQQAARAGPRPIRQQQRAAAQARSRGAHDAQPAPLSVSPHMQELEDVYMPVRSLVPGTLALDTLASFPQLSAGGRSEALASSQHVTRSRLPLWTARRPYVLRVCLL